MSTAMLAPRHPAARPDSTDAALDALRTAIARGDRDYRRLVREGEEVERHAAAARALLRSRGFLAGPHPDGRR